jgi:secondary thiamine-phosphate synthase enzyme
MVDIKTISVLSKSPFEMIKITEEVHRIVAESNVKNGLVAVITSHTTTGIVVNEGLDCVETDIKELLDRLVPLDANYIHAHFLPSYGATGNNSAGHLKSMLTGNHCIFPVIEGKIVCGSAQDIYLAECDGPQKRKIYVEIMGE